jgi:hypothetical protein
MAKSTAPKIGKSTPVAKKIGKSTPVMQKARQPQHPKRGK